MSTAHTSFPLQHDAISAQLRQELVNSLVHAGVLSSPALQQAFSAIPREAFVPLFYTEDETSPRLVWRQVTPDGTTPEDYLTKVYRDQSLVTKIDERHWPTSSSSMPSVMAKMLEALDLQLGHRVLEIGTGTGYNAALMATITGDPQNVVTIERDATLAANAAQVLGPGVTVVVGDGFVGWQQGAPYNRIIATASAPTLPMAWVEQLQPGGKLVMDLQGTLASGFLVVEKNTESVTGRFLPEPLHFMPLDTAAISLPQAKIASLLQQPCQATFVLEQDHIFPDKLFDSAFRWYLQWRIPGCQISKQKQVRRATESEVHSIFVIEPKSKTVMRLQKRNGEDIWHGAVYGSSQLWQNLQQAYEEFLVLGEPGEELYRLVVEQEGSSLVIGSFRFPLPRT